jgi:hypothetical protein
VLTYRASSSERGIDVMGSGVIVPESGVDVVGKVWGAGVICDNENAEHPIITILIK